MSDEYRGVPPTGVSTAPAEPVPLGAPPKKRRWIWWAVAAAAIVVGAVAVFLLTRTPNVAVPQTVGMTQAEAEAAVTAASLKLGTVDEVETLEAAPGTVVEQIPAAGEEVPEESPVDLTVAVVPVAATPDVIGMNLSEANQAIAVATLRPGDVAYEFDDEVEAGRIIAQTPEPGADVPVATFVDVTVSNGPEKDQVPNVVGLPESDATDILEAAGFQVRANKAESTTVPAGDVVAQSPAAGTETDPGSTVTLTVSTGAPEEPTQPQTPTEPETPTEPVEPETPIEPPSTSTTVPDLVGMRILEAIRTLLGANLKVGFDFGPSDEYLLKIAAQDPEAGSEVDRGTVVTVTIGLPEFIFDLSIQPLPAPAPPSTSTP